MKNKVDILSIAILIVLIATVMVFLLFHAENWLKSERSYQSSTTNLAITR